MKNWPTRILVLAIGLIVCTAASASPRKFAVIIGNNEGADPAQRLKYAEQDAKKMHKVLTELGDFAKKDTPLLLGKTADDAWKALRTVERKARAQAARQKQKTLLLVYYSGHAEGDVLEMGRTTLAFSKLRTFLEKSSVDVRVAFIDSCHSGKIIATKGGRRGPEFQIRVTDRITSTGYAIITSSAHNELSQESAELRGAFFTHFLVSALRGSGDNTRDGKVTLQEAYKYAYSRTLARTSATIGGSQHPMYHFQLEGRGEIVLTTPKTNRSQIAVTSVEDGRLLLLDGLGETILAESQVNRDQSAWLSVPPGNYLLYIISDDGGVRSANAVVRNGQVTRVDHRHFRSTELRTAMAKGGLFKKEEPRMRQAISIGGMFRYWPLAGASVSYGASAHYRYFGPLPFQPTVRINWTTAPDKGVSTNYQELGILGGIGHYWEEHRRLHVRLELLAGYEHIFQERWERQDRHTSAFNYLASIGLEVPVGAFFATLDTGAGGRVLQVLEKGWVHRFDFQAILSVGYRWGDL